MKIKTMVLVFLAVTAGVFAYTRPHNTIPSDLRDAVSDSAFDTLKKGAGAEASDIKVPEPGIKPFYVETGSRSGLNNKDYGVGNDPSSGAPAIPVEYINIPGGKFMMGIYSDEAGFGDTKPLHEVSIEPFQMAKTDVTVAQYAECVIKGVCTEPGTGYHCNWGEPGRQLHPVNCVDWDQAQAYAKFKGKGARLPSESEWEYAARSGGRNQKYPWGNDKPTSELAVFKAGSTMPVCSKPKGNTAQGLCDMAGNVLQWVEDKYQDSYEGAPVNGRAVVKGTLQVLRGGSFRRDDATSLRADYRNGNVPGKSICRVGFRLAR